MDSSVLAVAAPAQGVDQGLPASRWGTRYTRMGKTIWAQQRLPRRGH